MTVGNQEFSEEERAWAYLSRVVEGPSYPIHRALEHMSASELADTIARRAPGPNDVLEATVARHAEHREEEDLRAAAECGARLIYPGHPEWPGEQLDAAFGYALTSSSAHMRAHRSDCVGPHALWVRGGNLNLLTQQAVAVVGTRAISRYGMQAARLIAGGVAKHQWTVISGGALGIDTHAHEAALEHSAPTIIVAASGIDTAYPRRNAGLFDRVVEAGGAVVSEYPPGATPQRHRFLTRNRLVAALSRGTVVVEAAWRSGALNTLSWAESLGKVCMAVPGPVTQPSFLGSHQRIKNRTAELVTSADEVRELLEPQLKTKVEQQYELDFAADEVHKLSRTQLRVYDALARAEGHTASQVAASAGLPLPLTVHQLVGLLRAGLARLEGDTWRRG